jgi:LPXTG-motif cell wall-anchored protein
VKKGSYFHARIPLREPPGTVASPQPRWSGRRPSRGVKIYEWDVQNGWACVDTAAFSLSCKYTRAATTTPSTMHVAFQLPKKRGHFDFTAKVKTANPDPDKTNNTATWRVKTTAPTPTPKPTPTPTPTTTPAPPTSRVTVTGRIWNDANHNGRQDAGEKGIRGAKVVLLRTDGDSDREMRRVTTGSDGRYWFTRLPVLDPGTSRYVVLVGTPNRSWGFTKRDVGAERGDSDLTLDVPSGGPMPSYHRYFTKNSVVGYSDGMIIKAGKTGVVDGGLVKGGGSGGDTLPQTGVAAQGIAAGGGLLVAGGFALTLLGRRRRTANAAR